jgi:solute carrier family 25 protein 38
MDAYPSDYVVHNLPFIVLSGLGTAKELDPPPPVQDVLPGRAITTVNSEIAPVADDRADALLEEFLAADATNAPWNGRGSGRRGLTHGFRMRTVGRVRQAHGKMPCEGTPG